MAFRGVSQQRRILGHIALGSGLMLLILTSAGADRAHGGIGYRFTPGQTLSYSIEIEVDWAKKIERFSGTPVFVVKTVDPQSAAELFTIGKLTCVSRLRGAEEDTERPSRTIWIGSLVKVRSSGSVGGREDYNDNQLPDFLTTLVKLKELFFQDLPPAAKGLSRKQGNATLWMHTTGSLTDSGIKTIEGTETSVVRGSLVSGSIVQIHKERSFQSKKSPSLSLRYVSESRFDTARGLLLDTNATCTSDSGGGGQPPTVKIAIRLLVGQELTRAIDQANADWSSRPKNFDPVEFKRIRLDVRNLPRFNSPREAKPGMVVAHFSDSDNHVYLAEVIEVVSQRQYQVKIRYRGSGEVMVVHSALLAIPPAGKIPKG